MLTETDVGPHPNWVTCRFLSMCVATVISSIILDGFSAATKLTRANKPIEKILLAIVMTDTTYCCVGVVNYACMMFLGYVGMNKYLLTIAMDSLFNSVQLATLLWTPCLASFIMASGSPTFSIPTCWVVTWGFGGVYGLAWFMRMRTDQVNDFAQFSTLNVFVRSCLLVAYVGSVIVVLATAVVLHLRKRGFFGQARRIAVQEKLMRYLLIVLLIQGPYMLWNCTRWINNEQVQEMSMLIFYLTPCMNSILYGSRACCAPYRQGTHGNNSIDGNDDDDNNNNNSLDKLEELKGLSDVTFLAEGAGGSVHKARWLGIDVAVKLIKLPEPSQSQDLNLYQTMIKESQRAFLDEAAICAQLRHPNIMLFIRVGQYQGKLGILTEYCARGSLKDVLKHNARLDWKRKISLAHQIAQGLTYLHARNPTYIHRDLKCSNILVTETWQAKLADFGISKVSNFVMPGNNHSAHRMKSSMLLFNEATSFAGTWRWNAPEILVDTDHCRYNRATDMYSFGICLWEIASDGDIPFSDVSFDFEVREKVIKSERPVFHKSVQCPSRFRCILEKCWHQNPQERPSAEVVSNQLKELLDSIRKSSSRFSSSSLPKDDLVTSNKSNTMENSVTIRTISSIHNALSMQGSTSSFDTASTSASLDTEDDLESGKAPANFVEVVTPQCIKSKTMNDPENSCSADQQASMMEVDIVNNSLLPSLSEGSSDSENASLHRKETLSTAPSPANDAIFVEAIFEAEAYEHDRYSSSLSELKRRASAGR